MATIVLRGKVNTGSDDFIERNWTCCSVLNRDYGRLSDRTNLLVIKIHLAGGNEQLIAWSSGLRAKGSSKTAPE
jgi:hypothetical protein